MKPESKIIGISFLGGVAFWIVDSLIDKFYFYEDTFLNVLILKIPPDELYMRMTGLIFSFLFGILISKVYVKLKVKGEQQKDTLNHLNIILDSQPFVTYTRAACKEIEFTYISSNIFGHTGFKPEDFINNPGLWAERIHPEDKKDLIERAKRVVDGEPFEAEYRWQCSDGTWKWAFDSQKLIKPENGGEGEEHIVGLWHDVSERKAIQGRIIEQNTFLNNVLESLTHPFMIIDVDTHRIIKHNTAAFNEYSDEHITCHKLSHHRDEPCNSTHHPCPLEAVRRTGEPAVVNHIHYNKAGEEIYSEVHAYPILNDKGEVKQVIEYSIDVTGRMKMEEELVKRNRELNDFAYKVSHDLKNPVNIIKGYVMAIKDKPELFEKYFVKIEKQADQLISFIDRILKLSRVGRIIAKKENVKLNVLLSQLLITMIREDKTVRYSINLECNDVTGDPTGLEQVFSNLIQNSLQFRDSEKETLEIKVENFIDNDVIVIKYYDNGIGVKEEFIDKIFSPGATFGKNHGTGFGLAIVKKIIDAHEGRISVLSDGPGKGVCFAIVLPRRL